MDNVHYSCEYFEVKIPSHDIAQFYLRKITMSVTLLWSRTFYTPLSTLNLLFLTREYSLYYNSLQLNLNVVKVYVLFTVRIRKSLVCFITYLLWPYTLNYSYLEVIG